jgi:transcriptional regulator with GAF, ATPase, and Fis domain
MVRDKIQLRYSNATNEMEDYLDKIIDDSIKVQLYDNIIYTYNNLFSIWNEKIEIQEELDECKQTNYSQSVEITKKTEIVKKEKEKTIQEKEIDLIKKALAKHNGSKRLAAKELGTTERKLRKRMKELGI